MSKNHPGYCVSCGALSEMELSHQREINKRQAARIAHLEVLVAGGKSPDMEILQNIYARTRRRLSGGSDTNGK